MIPEKLKLMYTQKPVPGIYSSFILASPKLETTQIQRASVLSKEEVQPSSESVVLLCSSIYLESSTNFK
jgi:hypothetical protein